MYSYFIAHTLCHPPTVSSNRYCEWALSNVAFRPHKSQSDTAQTVFVLNLVVSWLSSDVQNGAD